MGNPTAVAVSSSSTVRAASWGSHPVAAGLIAAAALLVPGIAGVAVGLTTGAALAGPGGPRQLLTWLGAVAAGVVTTIVTDRLLRRLLPLAVLLRLSLDFPDRAPSRLRVALRAGTLRHLDTQLARVAAHGIQGDPTDAAARILELMSALTRYDRRTRGHSERVRAFTDVIADEMRLSRIDRDRLRWASLLHDIGKLHVDVAILNKVGGLDDGEWDAVRAHPHVGARIAAPLLPWLGEWGAAIEHHHERWDGGGYPHGIGGREIPLAARIVAVADAFEVMTAARSYKRPLSVPAARAELLACAGQQFDPQVVRALLSASLTRLRWIVGPAALLAVRPAVASARAAGTRFGELPVLRAGVVAAVATLSLPAVDGPLGSGEQADAEERGGRATAGTAAAASTPGSPVTGVDPATVHGVAGAAGVGDLLTFHRLLDLAPPTPPGAGDHDDAGDARDHDAPGPAAGGNAGQDPSATPPSDRRPPRAGQARATSPAGGPPSGPPPGAAVSAVARSGSGPGHGKDVSTTARSTDKPADR